MDTAKARELADKACRLATDCTQLWQELEAYIRYWEDFRPAYGRYLRGGIGTIVAAFRETAEESKAKTEELRDALKDKPHCAACLDWWWNYQPKMEHMLLFGMGPGKCAVKHQSATRCPECREYRFYVTVEDDGDDAE